MGVGRRGGCGVLNTARGGARETGAPPVARATATPVAPRPRKLARRQQPDQSPPRKEPHPGASQHPSDRQDLRARRSTRWAGRRSRSTPARSARPTRCTSTCEAARAAGYADVVAPPMFAVVYSAPVGRAADLRPRDRAQLRDDGPRRPGVRVGAAGGRGRRDHDDRERQGHLRSATVAATTCSSRSRPTSAASRSAAEPGPTSSEECERDGRSCKPERRSPR